MISLQFRSLIIAHIPSVVVPVKVIVDPLFCTTLTGLSPVSSFAVQL